MSLPWQRLTPEELARHRADLAAVEETINDGKTLTASGKPDAVACGVAHFLCALAELQLLKMRAALDAQDPLAGSGRQ